MFLQHYMCSLICKQIILFSNSPIVFSLVYSHYSNHQNTTLITPVLILNFSFLNSINSPLKVDITISALYCFEMIRYSYQLFHCYIGLFDPQGWQKGIFLYFLWHIFSLSSLISFFSSWLIVGSSIPVVSGRL